MPLPEPLIQSVSDGPSVPLPRLLIVGDPCGLNIAREALIELELFWDVVFADSAFDAHDIPAFRPVDLILIDLGNPHLDGTDLVESLHDHFPRIPIVLMTVPYGVPAALDAVRKGASNHFPRDLLTTEPAAVLECLQAAARGHQDRRRAADRLDRLSLEFTLSNDRAQIGPVVGRLVEGCLETGLCDRPAAARVAVALEEGLANAMIHGNLEVSTEMRHADEAAYERLIEHRRSTSPYADRQVKVIARISRNEGIFEIADDGPGFDVSRVPDSTHQFGIGGRGFLLMRSYMSEVHFGDFGNRVTMVKRKS